MFAQALEIRTKPGQARALCAVMDEKATPIITKYPGFVDGLCLVSKQSPDQVLAITVWEDKAAAEKFRPEDRATLTAYYRPFLAGDFRIVGYDIPLALTYKVRGVKA